MLAAFREFALRLLGRGEATIAVPSFDGALKPNQALERAETLAELEAPEDLATDGAALYVADGPRLARLEAQGLATVRAFERPITALACLPGGAIAVALDGREVRVYAAPDAAEPSAVFSGHDMRSVNALAPAAGDALYATDGSTTCDAKDWALDLMQRGHSGRALRLDLKDQSVAVLAHGLHYAFGVSASR